jgi:hypothetical protein
MAYPFQPVTLNPDQVITAAQVNHLPIIAHYARRLGKDQHAIERNFGFLKDD